MPKRKTLMRGISRAKFAWNDYLRTVALSEGIPDSYRQAILFLHRKPGSSQKNIAEFAGVTTSAINQVVKGMLQDGYLYKEAAPSDKRSCKLYLTESGEAVAARLRQKLDGANDTITAFVGAEREAELLEFLHQLTDFIQKELGQC